MRVLVTGGAGFIGTNLIKRLLSDGHEVISVDNYSTGKYENHQKGCDYYRRDLSDSHWWSLVDECLCEVTCECNIKPVDIVYHMAALARIQPSFNTPMETFQANVVATQRILEWSRLNNTPVIYAGSSTMHGDHTLNPYTFCKWQSEELVMLYNKIWKLPVSICRFYNVYGPHQLVEGTYCTVIGVFERLYREGKPLTITGDGEQRRDFTYVDDIVDGLIRCGSMLESNMSHKVNGQYFELGYGKNYSINEIAKAFGKNYPTKYIDARPGEMRETLNTDTKAKELLGWKPKNDIIKYIQKNYIS